MDNINLHVTRERFGRIVYTHKTYEKAAEMCFKRAQIIKLLNVLLLSLTSGSAIGSFFSDQYLIQLSSLLATISLFFLVYQLNTNDESIGLEYKLTANKLWFIREKHQNFIADIMNDFFNDDQIQQKRDELLIELNNLLESAPPTNNKAYLKAQKSLKFNEEMTFSDDEIDQFLPNELRIGTI